MMPLKPCSRNFARAVVLVAGYIALLTWLTWPLAASLGSALPWVGVSPFVSRIDLYYSVWVLSHGSHALVSSATPFADANIYHPATSALFYGPAGFGALPLFAPVFLASGNPVLAMNVTFLLGLALTGVAMHVIVRRWTKSDLAGAVGASTVILNQWLMHGFLPTAPHWAALFCLPLIAFVAATRMDSMRSSLVLVPLIVLQSLTDLVYVAPAVFAPLGLLVAIRFARQSTRAAGVRLAAALVLSLLFLAPILYGYWSVVADNPDIASQSRWANNPAWVSVLPDRLFRGPNPFLLTPVAIVLMVIGAMATISRRRAGVTGPLPGGWGHGALWAIVGGGLALGPTVQIGTELFPGPLGFFIEWVPSLDAIRVPNRLGIAGLLGLGLLSGVAFGEIAGWIRANLSSPRVSHCLSGMLAALVLALIYRAYVGNFWTFRGPGVMPQAYKLRSAPSPIPSSFLPILTASKAPLLELPAGPGSRDPSRHTLAMFHSIYHRRPILNGYSSYWPTGFSKRMADAALLPAQGALDRLVEDTNLSLIWVHTNALGPARSAAWASVPAPEEGHRGLVLVAREGPDLLFAVRPTPTGSIDGATRVLTE